MGVVERPKEIRGVSCPRGWVACGNRGRQPMERRKFVIGLGSLAAGGAAATGTGALSQAAATRAVDIGVVNDSSAVLGLKNDVSSLENTEYTSYENGSLQLQFGENADLSNDGISGDGLNPDSTLDFDNVFRIQSQGQDTLQVSIDKSNLDNPEDITFYGASMTGDVYTDPSGDYIRDSDWTGQISAGFGVNIGVRIETPDEVDESWETGYIVIQANDPDDVSTN